MELNRHLQLCQIGQKIREHRKRLGLNQGDLAALLGISYQQLQKYEKGKSPLPSDRLQKLAERFGIPSSALLPNEGEHENEAPVQWTTNLDPDEFLLLEAFRALPDARTRKAVSTLLKGLDPRK